MCMCVRVRVCAYVRVCVAKVDHFPNGHVSYPNLSLCQAAAYNVHVFDSPLDHLLCIRQLYFVTPVPPLLQVLCLPEQGRRPDEI